MAYGNPPEEFTFHLPALWPAWRDRFLRYMEVNNLTAKDRKVQVATLLYAMGPEADTIYEAVFNYTVDLRYTDAWPQLDELVEKFNSYFYLPGAEGSGTTGCSTGQAVAVKGSRSLHRARPESAAPEATRRATAITTKEQSGKPQCKVAASDAGKRGLATASTAVCAVAPAERAVCVTQPTSAVKPALVQTAVEAVAGTARQAVVKASPVERVPMATAVRTTVEFVHVEQAAASMTAIQAVSTATAVQTTAEVVLAQVAEETVVQTAASLTEIQAVSTATAVQTTAGVVLAQVAEVEAVVVQTGEATGVQAVSTATAVQTTAEVVLAEVAEETVVQTTASVTAVEAVSTATAVQTTAEVVLAQMAEETVVPTAASDTAIQPVSTATAVAYEAFEAGSETLSAPEARAESSPLFEAGALAVLEVSTETKAGFETGVMTEAAELVANAMAASVASVDALMGDVPLRLALVLWPRITLSARLSHDVKKHRAVARLRLPAVT